MPPVTRWSDRTNPLESPAVADDAVSIPGSHAARQDALSGASVKVCIQPVLFCYHVTKYNTIVSLLGRECICCHRVGYSSRAGPGFRSHLCHNEKILSEIKETNLLLRIMLCIYLSK